MITAYQFMRIVEIRTKLISMSGFLLGAAYAWYVGDALSLPVFFVMAAAVLAVDMATTGFNTFFDFFHGVDRRGINREEDKVLVHQGVPAGTALIISVLLYLLAMVLGVVLAFMTSFWVIVIGAVCMAIGFLYNAGPLPLSRTPMGEVFAGGFLGWVLVTLTIFVFLGSEMGSASFLIGLPSMLLVGSILTVNNTCDIQGDAAAGRRTLSILLGKKGGEALVYVQGAAAFAIVAVYAFQGVVPVYVIWGVLPAGVLSIPVYLAMHRRGYSHATKGPSMGSISRVFLYYSLGFLIPLLYAAAADSVGY